ncbi:hypothetical protein DM860_000016 [Cuscuta australis]|uniref:Uncharacterized protein n=1 Tax=Cuscuta australis TaxID=267555 RepID=A0A328CVH7_9ASTE|nr:hypothetical protein DM860_000016 [Cuscuta australis]
MLITGSVSLTRLLIDHPMAPSSFGAWLNHAGTQHVGAIMFLVAHFFLCSGVTVLTVTQASQTDRNNHVVIDVNNTCGLHNHHLLLHSLHWNHSSCSSSKSRSESAPFGLGIGFGKNDTNAVVIS